MAKELWHSAGCIAILLVLVACGGSAPQAEQGAPVRAGPRVDPALVAERTVEGMPPLACGSAPIDVLVAEPGIEDANTAESRALREAFPLSAGSMSPQHAGGWVLMEHNGNRVRFGQREGKVGIGATLVVARYGDSYRFEGSGGCGPIGFPDGRQADPFDAVLRSTELELHYTGGRAGTGRCTTPDDQIVLRETADQVGVILLRLPVPKHPDYECTAEGHERVVTARLQEPLGSREIYNLGYLPARTVAPRVDGPASAPSPVPAATERQG